MIKCGECVRHDNCWIFDEHKDDNGTCVWAESKSITESPNEAIKRQNDVIEVVRCKDCRHGQYDATHYFCAEHHHKVYEDDYCSHGQRLSNFGELAEQTKYPATYNTNTKCGGCVHLDELGRCLNFVLAKDDRSCWRGSWENNGGCVAEQTEVKENDELLHGDNHNNNADADYKSHIRLIDADVLKDLLKARKQFFVDAYGGSFHCMSEKDKARCDEIDACIASITNAQTVSADAVEVVRCKDCKHKYVSGNGTTQYYVCDFMDAQYEEDGFCHHAESEVEE